MSKTNKILLVLVVILVIALGAIVYAQKFKVEKEYYAVYMNTGDLYFGQLESFPKPVLTNILFLQKNQSGQFGLAKFSEASWGPEDRLYLNDKNIVWTSRLSSSSDVLKAIKNPELMKAASQTPSVTDSTNQSQDNITSTTEPTVKSAPTSKTKK